MKIYFAAALTYSTEEYRKFITDLKDLLRKNYEILDFVGLNDADAKDVFEHDTSCVKQADVIIADCTYPSIGLGYEIGLAVSLNKPVIAIARADAKVSKMVTGINHSAFKYQTYTDPDEVLTFIPKLL